MSININRLRDRLRIIGSDKETQSTSDLPADHRLTFRPSRDETWTFEDDQVLLNDEDVNELINENSNDIHCLNYLSSGLDSYRQHVWQTVGTANGKYNGKVNALLEKILGRLGNIYDGLVGGVSFEMSGGNFWINNVNLRSVLKLYQVRPTPKARCYLVGLRNKLALILQAQNGNSRYDGIREEAVHLFNEISCALDRIPADDSNYLLPAAGNC